MQSFIVEHYLNRNVDVYCGGTDTFNGEVVACADGVLTLEKDGVYTHIAIDKLIAIWGTDTK
ncbi:MAG: MM0924 family protein [Methermicoccaceae archaeon]